MVTLKTYGNTSSQKALVLLHAFPLSSEMYRDVIARLESSLATYQIILANLPCFGDAPKLTNWTLAEAMSDLHSQLISVGITSSALCGVSMGGYAALAYYKQFQSEVSALILSNTKAEADNEEGKANREKLAKDVEEKGYEPIFSGMMLKLIGKSAITKNPTLLHTVKLMIASESLIAISEASRAMAKREDSTDLLGQISIPTLVIAGTEDELIPEAIMKVMSAKIPNVVYVPMEQHGHLCVIEDPVVWSTAIINFLQKNNGY